MSLTDRRVERDGFPQTGVQLTSSLPASFQGDGVICRKRARERRTLSIAQQAGGKKKTETHRDCYRRAHSYRAARSEGAAKGSKSAEERNRNKLGGGKVTTREEDAGRERETGAVKVREMISQFISSGLKKRSCRYKRGLGGIT